MIYVIWNLPNTVQITVMVHVISKALLTPKMMLLACKSKGIVGGVFARPDSNHNMDERVIFESRARELGIEVPS